MAIADRSGLPVAAGIASASPHETTLVEETIDNGFLEHAPDQLVLPGPGNTLGGVCGQVLVAEGWRGLGSRSDFETLQAGGDPPLRSLRR